MPKQTELFSVVLGSFTIQAIGFLNLEDDLIPPCCNFGLQDSNPSSCLIPAFGSPTHRLSKEPDVIKKLEQLITFPREVAYTTPPQCTYDKLVTNNSEFLKKIAEKAYKKSITIPGKVEMGMRKTDSTLCKGKMNVSKIDDNKHYKVCIGEHFFDVFVLLDNRLAISFRDSTNKVGMGIICQDDIQLNKVLPKINELEEQYKSLWNQIDALGTSTSASEASTSTSTEAAIPATVSRFSASTESTDDCRHILRLTGDQLRKLWYVNLLGGEGASWYTNLQAKKNPLFMNKGDKNVESTVQQGMRICGEIVAKGNMEFVRWYSIRQNETEYVMYEISVGNNAFNVIPLELMKLAITIRTDTPEYAVGIINSEDVVGPEVKVQAETLWRFISDINDNFYKGTKFVTVAAFEEKHGEESQSESSESPTTEKDRNKKSEKSPNVEDQEYHKESNNSSKTVESLHPTSTSTDAMESRKRCSESSTSTPTPTFSSEVKYTHKKFRRSTSKTVDSAFSVPLCPLSTAIPEAVPSTHYSSSVYIGCLAFTALVFAFKKTSNRKIK